MEAQPGLIGVTGFPSIARLASRGTKLATLVSAFAFAFSAVSFYETVLKQADLKVYVTDTISYTRDPYGGYEVIALPVTIANGGARDGAVVNLQLKVKNLDTGQTETLTSSYTADAQYFGGREDVANRVKRPKLPFAPLAISGRSAYAGTILFYTAEGRQPTDAKTLIGPSAKVEMTLNVIATGPTDWLDQLISSPPEPITLSGKVDALLARSMWVTQYASACRNHGPPLEPWADQLLHSHSVAASHGIGSAIRLVGVEVV
jgi:hypothetical protein